MPRTILATLGLAFAVSALAQDVAYSPPVGGITVTFAASVSGVPKISTFTPSLRMPIGSSFVGKPLGTLTGVTSTTLSDSSAGWQASALSQASTPYFVRITSGSAAGSWWQVSTSTASTSTTVTVTNRGISPTAAGVQSGDTYEVVPADTLATFLGSIATSIGGASAGSADNVLLHDGVQWREYYYNTSANQWREGTSTFNRNNTIIRPDSGVVYVRRSASTQSIVMMGKVATRTERITVSAAGVSPVGNVFPVSATLGSLAIQSNSGFVAFTGTLAAADKVNVFDGVNWRSFHYNSSVGQWREGTSTFNRNTFAVPVGAPVVVERGTGATSAFFVTLTPPYSL